MPFIENGLINGFLSAEITDAHFDQRCLNSMLMKAKLIDIQKIGIYIDFVSSD